MYIGTLMVTTKAVFLFCRNLFSKLSGFEVIMETLINLKVAKKYIEKLLS